MSNLPILEEALSTAISMEGIARRFTTTSGTSYTAVEGIRMSVQAGTFVSVVGPSGCGKSTVLNMTAGLMQPTEGSIEIFGDKLTGINKRASYLFQQDALLPWKSVLDNVRLGLEFRGRNSPEAMELARSWVRRVGLEQFSASYPHQLSGGMRKRAAMAQSWIVDPDILLMDEPFSALDIHTRQRMESELLGLWSGSNKTVLFVTHDLEEAIALSDRVLVLSAGPGSRIVGEYEVDLPRPRNLIDIKTEPHFTELYRSIWSDLKQEVLKSYERQ
jgi:NitT/TauT family transport system ATP-binding protein